MFPLHSNRQLYEKDISSTRVTVTIYHVKIFIRSGLN